MAHHCSAGPEVIPALGLKNLELLLCDLWAWVQLAILKTYGLIGNFDYFDLMPMYSWYLNPSSAWQYVFFASGAGARMGYSAQPGVRRMETCFWSLGTTHCYAQWMTVTLCTEVFIGRAQSGLLPACREHGYRLWFVAVLWTDSYPYS